MGDKFFFGKGLNCLAAASPAVLVLREAAVLFSEPIS